MENYRRSFFIVVQIITCYRILKVHAQCSGEPEKLYVGYEGVSLRFPNTTAEEYGTNLTCEWLITSTVEAKILYKIRDIKINCPDSLSIYDGASTSANAKKKDVCTQGSTISHPIDTTSGQNLFIRFTSDESATSGKDGGFLVYLVSAPDLSQCSKENEMKELTANGTEAGLTSPGFPRTYPKNVNCNWVISPADPDMVVTLKVTFLDVETKIQDGSCLDQLIIKYGNSLNSTTYCGNEKFSPPKMTFTSDVGENMTVMLKSDDIQEEYGFVAVYNQTEPVETTTMPVIVSSTKESSATDRNKGNSPPSDNKSDNNANVIVPSVLVPIVVIIAIVLGVLWYRRRSNSEKRNITNSGERLNLNDKT